MTSASVPMPAADERLGVVLTDPGPGAALDTARRFALTGHIVVMGARRSADAEQAAQMLRRGGAAAFGVHLDLTDLSSVNAFAATAAYLAGPLDVLILGSPATPTATSDGQECSLGVQHLAAQLLSVTPRRRDADLLVVSYTGNPATDPPSVCSSSRFTAGLHQWALTRAGASEPCSDSIELQSLLDEWQYTITMPDRARKPLCDREPATSTNRTGSYHQTQSLPDDLVIGPTTARSAAATATRR